MCISSCTASSWENAQLLFFSYSTTGMRSAESWVGYHTLMAQLNICLGPPFPSVNIRVRQHLVYPVYIEGLGIKTTQQCWRRSHSKHAGTLLLVCCGFLHVMVWLTPVTHTDKQHQSIAVPHSHSHTHTQCNYIRLGGGLQGVTNIWRGLRLPLRPAGSFDSAYPH